ncbi:MAG: CxxxxCH/CxxCH domain-containing protein [Anaeromyxobacteraceae bacterium]
MIGRAARWVGVVGVALLALGAGRAGAATATYYVEPAAAVNVGADGSTTMTALVDLAVSAPVVPNTHRAITNTTVPAGTARWRIRPAAATTEANAEYFRAYTPTYASAMTISANATAYADFYMSATGGTSVQAFATLYEYNGTTGVVGAAKGTATFNGSTSVTTRQTMNNASFGNASFTVAAGNRLMVIYGFTTSNTRPAFLWGQTASATPSGYQAFTVTETAAPSNTIQVVTGGNVAVPANVCPGNTVYADQFGFTATGAADRVSALTVSGLQATTPLAAIAVADDAGATITSLAPTANTQAFSWAATNLAAPVGTTYYRLYFTAKSHAVLGATVPGAVTPIVLDTYTSTNIRTPGSDTANSFTIDNTAQANPGTVTVNGATGTSLNVSWVASTGAAEYVVYGRKGATPTSTPTDGVTPGVQAPSSTADWVAWVGTTNNAGTISGLDSSSGYTFKIFARDACSNWSTSTTVTGSGTTLAPPTPPGTPGTPGFTNVTAAGLTATWTASSTGTTPITYTLQWDNAGTWTNVGPSCTGASLLTCNVTGLTQNTSYTYRVLASNGSAPDATSATAAALTRPGQPVMAAYSNLGATGVTINWTMALPTNGLTYRLQWNNAGTWTDVASCTALSTPSCNVSGLSPNTSYSYQVFAHNTSGDGAASTPPLNVTTISFIADGDSTLNSPRPVVSIINPMSGAVVSQPARIQVRIFSPGGAPLLTGVDAPKLLVDGADPGAAVSAVGQKTAYPGSVTNVVGVWEFTLNSLTASTAGTAHTLRAVAKNASGAVYSGTVTVVLKIDKGDGNLLVRDNSSQLCSDCHAGVMSHSSETTGSKFGSWATTCRDCHTPHSTKNLSLVRMTIKAPERDGATTAQPVTFLNKSGFAAGSYAQPGTGPANTGVCEVCHTQTAVYQADGLLADGVTPAAQGNHGTGPCGNCHKHKKGLAASCTACHGDATETRTAAIGADPKFQAAPPIVSASPNPVPNVFVAAGGEHLKHVTLATYKNAPLQCNDCHAGASHQPTPQVDIGYSLVATGNGVLTNTSTPALSPLSGALMSTWTTTPTCTNWCHGDGLAGGGRGLVWNWATAQTTTCASCHGQATGPVAMPNLANAHHPQNSACANCHGAGYATTGLTSPAIGTHIDGTVQHGTGCRACHGVIQPAGTTPVALNTDFSAAPGYTTAAVDSKGNTARTAVGVGAHIKHVNAGTFMSAKCGECHTIPADNNILHANGTVAWSWATTAGIAPSYTSPTCTNYCHSNAAPLGGTVQTKSTIAWNSTTTPMDCTTCHQTATFGGTGLSVRHQKHVATYPYTCDECHAPTMLDNSSATIGTVTNHVNGAKDVDFATTAVAASINQSGGNYTSTVTAPNYTCASTYCHSGGVATSAPFSATASAAIAWNSATSTTCQSCHGWTATTAPTMGVALGSSFQGSAVHMNHVANAGVIGTNYVCGACHQNTVAATTDSPITTAANHVNGVKDVSIAPRGAIATTQVYAGTCNTTYCHSSGQRAYTFSPIAWTGPALGCTGCHGTGVGNTTGAPDYTNGGVNSATANSHSAHATSSATCTTCHNTFVTTAGTAINGSSHTNGVINVAFDTAVAGTVTYAAGTAAPTSATCTNVKCHGNNATAAVWGATMDCTGCHMGATGTADAEVDDFTYNNGTVAKLDPEDWITNGHGLPSTGTYDSGTAGAGFDTAIAVSSDDGCKYCHDKGVPHGQFGVSANPFRLANVGAGNTVALKNGVCTACHGGAGYLGKTSFKGITADHHGTKHVTTNGGELCWDCHDPHGDSRYTTNATETPVVAANEALGYMIEAKLVTTHPSAEGNTTEWGTNGTVGPTYAAKSPRFNKSVVAPTTSYDWGDYVLSANQNGLCQVCHTSTVHFTSTAWSTTIPSHSDADSTHNTTGGRCTKCHAHNQPPSDAFRASCSGCHGNKGLPLTPVNANTDPMLDYAPPTAADGTSSATTVNGVGAHQSHVNQITLRTDPLLCSQCHGPSASLPRHPGTGLAYIEWGSLATTGAVTPTYARGTGCSLTYCHGNFKNGNDKITPVIPGAPSNLTFPAVADNTLTVSWTGAAGATIYKIERAPDVSGAPGAWLQVGTSAGTSFNDGGLWAATTYWYRVRAWSSAGDGPYSGNFSRKTTGGNPGPLTAFNYSWQWDDTGDTYAGLQTSMPVSGCDLTYQTATTAVVTTMSSTTNTCTDRLYTSAGGGVANAPLMTVVLTTPFSVATPITSPSITWNVRTGAGTTTLGTQLGYVASGTFTGFGTVAQTSVSTTVISASPNMSAQTGSVPAGASLALRFTRVTTDVNVMRIYFSSTLGITNVTHPGASTPPTLPAAPTGTPTISGFSGVGTASMTLAWNTVNLATSYKVERSLDGSTGWVQVGQPTVNSLTDIGLTPNTPYWYRVKASNAGGDAPAYSPTASQPTAAAAGLATSWTGTFTPGATTLTCASCHGNPPGGTHPAMTNCSLCHTNYDDATAVPQRVDKARHINGLLEYDGDCVSCHTYALGSRSAVVGEFNNAWSHKRTAAGVVTIWDCIVCHMEGDPATGKPSGDHMNSVVNLRDPDTGNNIQIPTWTNASGASPGSFTTAPAAPNATFTKFSRDLSLSLESDPNASTLYAIEINQCLKCHDSNGAAAIAVGKPLAAILTAIPGSSPEKPFGTTIAGAGYTGAGIVANNVTGGVTDIYESFKTTNASYHPILGKQNNSYANSTDMVTPWNMTKTTGNTTSWGYLMSCWDCHAPFGTASTVTLTRTVTAHGGATTIRGSTFINNSTTTQFCRVCHLLPANTSGPHGTGSATSAIDGNPQQYLSQQCHLCHGSQTSTKPARPIAGQDSHGFDSFAPAMGADKMWPLGATESYKPYAFMRNVGPSGQWRSGSNSWRPASGPGVPTGGATCQGTLCRSSHGNYTPGGVY